MRFAGGVGAVGSPTECSLPVMALPCFLLFPCDLEREAIERKRYPLVFCSTLMISFPGQGTMHIMQWKKKDELQSLAL